MNESPREGHGRAPTQIGQAPSSPSLWLSVADALALTPAAVHQPLQVYRGEFFSGRARCSQGSVRSPARTLLLLGGLVFHLAFICGLVTGKVHLWRNCCFMLLVSEKKIKANNS